MSAASRTMACPLNARMPPPGWKRRTMDAATDRMTVRQRKSSEERGKERCARSNVACEDRNGQCCELHRSALE